MTTDRKDKRKWFMALAFLAAAALLSFAYVNRGIQPSRLLKTPGRPAPDFLFLDRSDRMVSSAEFRGAVWVADFIFTKCAGTCPLLAKEMTALLDEWAARPDFKLVSFTVDPERDTVETLRKYADDFKADWGKWRFLTGKKEDLYRVIRDGFLENAEESAKPRRGSEFIHSSKLVLVDRSGNIRGSYDMEHEGDMEALRKDVRYLMAKDPLPDGGMVQIHLPAPKVTFIERQP
jgi:cytochrome oxidase Cu insertion factor (SCO1/SenC/PrrC family)